MRRVNVATRLEASAVEALIPPSTITTTQETYKMNKLSALIAALFATASIGVLAQATAAKTAEPAKATATTRAHATTAIAGTGGGGCRTRCRG